MPTVLITGAASGIGRAAALRLARCWRCVLVDRDAHGLSATMAALVACPPGDHKALVADLTDAQSIDALGAHTGTLDALINNAGMSDHGKRPVVEQEDDAWRALLALNLEAPARLVDALSGRLTRGARIVNVASGAGLRAIPWRGAYSPSKAGLIAMSRALARRRRDLCVTTLCPGFVRTELVDHLIETERLNPEHAVAKISLGRMADPADMAEALCFLAGPGAWPLSGLALSVDGGSSVFGGSQAFAPAQIAPVPFDAPTDFHVVGAPAGAWAAVGPAGSGYPAVLDVTPLAAAPGEWLRNVHASARRFAQRYASQASLTLLLPPEDQEDWRAAGDAAAARMLVATLACEWGARALRVNALQLARPDVRTLAPLLRFIAGPGAQYLTGQVLALPRADAP